MPVYAAYLPGGEFYTPPTPVVDYTKPVGQGLPGQVWVTQYAGGSKGQTPIAGKWDYPGGNSALGGLFDTSNLGSSLSDVASGMVIPSAFVLGGAALAGGLGAGAAGAGAANLLAIAGLCRGRRRGPRDVAGRCHECAGAALF